MPRTGRLHIPGGGCYHLIGRGLERRTLFEDPIDKQDFLDRLGKNLDRTQCQCLVWALKEDCLGLDQATLRSREDWTLDKLIRCVCALCDIEEQALVRKTRSNDCSRAKALICLWGTSELGMTTTEIDEQLQISQQVVSKWIKKGQCLVESSNLNFPDSAG
ncbi:MAG: hypothetical protein R3F50_11160 [Gammaproteobacteria bacterium]|jgi:hypothetical protein